MILLNSNNIETIEILDKKRIEEWKFTNVLKWTSLFWKRERYINVDLKWYNITEFKILGSISDKKDAAKRITQFSTDQELLHYLNQDNNKYTILKYTVYLKPCVRITFISGKYLIKYFDSMIKATEYVDDLKSKMKKEMIIYF